MSNAMTEHSRKLRSQTAAAYAKKALAEGTIRQITMRLQAQDADELDAIAQELGLSRPQVIKKLCELYRKSA